MLDDIFGSPPSYDLLKPIGGELALLWSVMFGIGLVFMVGYFALNGFKLGTAGNDMNKSAGAVMGIKNVLFGVGVLLIGIPLLLAIIQGGLKLF